nr:hypothetical protein [Tanacetum cinerariifolium]
MELYMMNIQHGRVILESVENGPLIWPTIEDNGVTRSKKYSELSVAEATHADCDLKATNIILQGLPLEVYELVSNHQITKELWERIQLLMQGTSLTKQERECKLYDKFNKFSYKKRKHYYGSLYQSSTPLSITYPSNDYQSSIYHNVYSPPSSIPQLEYAPTVTQQQQSKFPQLNSGLTVPVFKQDPGILEDQATQTVINHNVAYQADDLDAYDSNCDEINTSKVALMANLSHVLNHLETEITSDSNIIPYSQYVKETQQAAVQNSSSYAQQDALILSVIEQLKTQAVEQHRLESKTFEIKMNQILNENERLFEQINTKDIVNIVVNSSMDNAAVNMHECKECLKLEIELLNKKDFVEKVTYNKLFRRYTTLEKHCISLEVDTQLN